MFRLLQVKPPHGWKVVVWELAIVTVGVLIALAAQEWAEGLSWRGKVAATEQALRAELGEHYGYAVEFRTVYPCLQVQLDRLRSRVLSSGSVMNPAPLYEEDGAHYVLRLPSKDISHRRLGGSGQRRHDPEPCSINPATVGRSLWATSRYAGVDFGQQCH